MTDNDRIAILEQQLYHEYKIRRGDTVSFKLSDYGFIIHRDHIWENVHFKIGKRYRVLLESVEEDSLPDNQMMYCTHFVVRRNQYYRVAMIDEL